MWEYELPSPIVTSAMVECHSPGVLCYRKRQYLPRWLLYISEGAPELRWKAYLAIREFSAAAVQ